MNITAQSPTETSEALSWAELGPLPAKTGDRIGPSLGVNRWIDLALHLPLRYQDEATISPCNGLVEGVLASVMGEIAHSQVTERPRKSWQLRVSDESGDVTLRFLHFYPNQVKKFAVGVSIKATGQVRHTRFGFEMVHPKLELLNAPSPHELTTETTHTTPVSDEPVVLTPIYPTTAGVKQTEWRRWTALLPQACYEDCLTSAAPSKLVQRMHLPSWQEALKLLHREASVDTQQSLNERTHPAWERIKLDEVMAQQLALQQARLTRKQWQAAPMRQALIHTDKQLIDLLPFKLTGAQERAWQQIQQDLGQELPMQRLLQGDVGSGKTAVAALACAFVAQCGAQAAMMAPTEILAEQHYKKLSPLFQAMGLRCERLMGAMSKKEKERVSLSLTSGETQVVVGTHALIQDHVRFKQLGLVVVDEQHRFGVQQRLALLQASNHQRVAHQLMMTATPIPRTLAQSYLADLDVSVLDEKPPGRQAIVTKLISQTRRAELVQSIELELNNGRQVYWVCPLIEESEALQLQAAEQSYAELLTLLPDHRIALLHGKLAATEKAHIMQTFSQGDIDVLVSTTVIEVGVDVPNATLMVIEHAERFGLAQLHQLRGRVGRGSLQSVCVMLYGQALSLTGKQRLKALRDSNDGFWLAEKDLEIRGPGELLGRRQSGIPTLRFANPLRDLDLFKAARDIAQSIDVQTTPWAQRLIKRWFADNRWWLT